MTSIRGTCRGDCDGMEFPHVERNAAMHWAMFADEPSVEILPCGWPKGTEKSCGFARAYNTIMSASEDSELHVALKTKQARMFSHPGHGFFAL